MDSNLLSEVISTLLSNLKGLLLFIQAVRDTRLPIGLASSTESWLATANYLQTCLAMPISQERIVQKVAIQAIHNLARQRPCPVDEAGHLMAFDSVRSWTNDVQCFHCGSVIENGNTYHCNQCSTDMCMECAGFSNHAWDERAALATYALNAFAQHEEDFALCDSACNAIRVLDVIPIDEHNLGIFNLLDSLESMPQLSIPGMLCLWSLRGSLDENYAAFACHVIMGMLAHNFTDPTLCGIALAILLDICGHPRVLHQITNDNGAASHSANAAGVASMSELLISMASHVIQSHGAHWKLVRDALLLTQIVLRPGATVDLLLTMNVIGDVLPIVERDTRILVNFIHLLNLVLVLADNNDHAVNSVMQEGRTVSIMLDAFLNPGLAVDEMERIANLCLQLSRLRPQVANQLSIQSVLAQHIQSLAGQDRDEVVDVMLRLMIDLTSVNGIHLHPRVAGVLFSRWSEGLESEDNADPEAILTDYVNLLVPLAHSSNLDVDEFWTEDASEVVLETFVDEDLMNHNRLATAVMDLVCCLSTQKPGADIAQHQDSVSLAEIAQATFRILTNNPALASPVISFLWNLINRDVGTLPNLVDELRTANVPRVICTRTYTDETVVKVAQLLIRLIPQEHSDPNTAQDIVQLVMRQMDQFRTIRDQELFQSLHEALDALSRLCLQIADSQPQALSGTDLMQRAAIMEDRLGTATCDSLERLIRRLRTINQESRRPPQCNICMERDANFVSTTCYHAFCQEDGERLISDSGQCPFCRAEMNEIRQVYFG